MKNKKAKLLASLTSLVLVLAVMAVGVWAAAGQTVNVTTTVTFSATGVSGTITGTLTGVGGATQYYNSTNALAGTPIAFSPSGTALSAWTLGDGTALAIDSADGIASDLVYTFTITNASTTDAMVVALNDLTVGTNLEVVSVVQDSTPITGAAGDYALTNIGTSGTSTVVVTVNVVNDAISITSADISFNIALTSPNAT